MDRRDLEPDRGCTKSAPRVTATPSLRRGGSEAFRGTIMEQGFDLPDRSREGPSHSPGAVADGRRQLDERLFHKDVEDEVILAIARVMGRGGNGHTIRYLTKE